MAVSWHLLCFITLVVPDPIPALLFGGWPTKDLVVVPLFVPVVRPSTKGKYAFSQLLFMPQMGPKGPRRPFCTPQVSLVDVCVSCSPSSSHYHPYFPTESVLRPPVFNEGRNHTSHLQFWCLWVQFNSDTTYLEIESNFKVKIQSQETVLHFRCGWQTQLLPAFVLQTRGLYNPVLSCSSVAQLCPTFCHPMNGSTPGFPVLHCLLQFAPIHVHGPLFAFG